MDKSATVSGKIRLNGKEYTNTDLKRMSGYVMQDDLLNPHLTVDETLWYTVKLKLEPTFTEAELAEKVNTVVKQVSSFVWSSHTFASHFTSVSFR